MRKSSHRVGKCDKIGRAETHSAGSRAARTNLKNLSEELLPLNQVKRQRVGQPGREPRAARARGRGRQKLAGRNAEQSKGPRGSAGKPAAKTSLNNLSKELLLRIRVIRRRGRTLGRKSSAVTVRHSGLRRIVGRTEKRHKGRTGSASKAAAQTNLKRCKPLHRRGHPPPTALVFSPRASEVSAAAVSRMRAKDPAKAAGGQSDPRSSQSRPKRQERLLKMCSSVAKAAKTSIKKGVARLPSAASPMFNNSGSAATKKLKGRDPAAHKPSSNNRELTVRRAVKREIRRAVRRARTLVGNKAPGPQPSFLTLSRKRESSPRMKKLFLVLGCVAFISASAFAGDCCSGKKSKEGSKTEDSTKQSFAEAR
jgi:hypothetical protein